MLDDDRELCVLVDRFFKRLPYHFRFFVTIREFEQAILEDNPHALVLDQMMPIKSGLDVLRNIRAVGFNFPVLMLSAMGSPQDRIRGLEAGANDYLAKPFICRELQLRLEQLIKPAQNENANFAKSKAHAYQLASFYFTPDKNTISIDNAEHKMTRGECVLLEILCEANQSILNRSDMLRLTGSLVKDDSSRTIDVRMSRLKRKLRDLNNGIELIETVRGEGYRLTAPSTPILLK